MQKRGEKGKERWRGQTASVTILLQRAGVLEYKYLLFLYKGFAMQHPLHLSRKICPCAFLATSLALLKHNFLYPDIALAMTRTQCWRILRTVTFLPLVLILKTLVKFTFSSNLSLALCLQDFTSEPLLTYFFQIYCTEEKRSQLSPCLLSQDKHGAYDRVPWDWFTLQFTTQARI